ncbi:MAG: sulfatase-like hydrolase/transferase [Bacteroidota bacterium]
MKLFCALTAFILLVSCSASHQESYPNIVLILADDLGYGDIKALNPEGRIPTPHMDDVVENGLNFTDAHSNSSVCTPSRYGLLTGRYAWRTRLKSRVTHAYDRPLIEENRLTIASMLKSKGYETAAIGKWHLGMNWAPKEGKVIPLQDRLANESDVNLQAPITDGPSSVGFDYFYGISASANFPPYAFIEGGQLVEQPSMAKPDSIFGMAGSMVSKWNYRKLMPALTDKVVNYLEKRSKSDKPFFLYLPFTAPHTPIAPTLAAVGRSEAGKYGDFVTVLDDAVGQVMNTLDELGIAENTLVIVTSDNGSPARVGNRSRPGTVISKYGHRANGGKKGLKGDIYEGGHRIPFIWYWPKNIKEKTSTDRLVSFTDVFATLANLVGFELPPNTAEDSFSFLSEVVQNPNEAKRAHIVHHSFDGMFGYRSGQWKLTERLGSGGFTNPRTIPSTPTGPKGQLFDLSSDPFEETNLWDVNAEKAEQLSQELLTIQNQGYSRPGAQRSPPESFLARLKPAPVGGGFKMDGYYVWGMSVVKGDDGLYHGFASRWDVEASFKNWVTNSEIVHAVSETPAGPYRFESVALGRRGKGYWDGDMAHNPIVKKIGDTYVLYYIGTTYEGTFPTLEASVEFRKEARANQRIGMATSKSPYGPWERRDEPIIDTRPNKWDALLTANPAVSVRPDGTVLLIYKSTEGFDGKLKLGVTEAATFEGPYKRLRDEPILDFEETTGIEEHVEDPYIWWNGEQYELIMKDLIGNICGERGGGIHATSKNGIDWVISRPAQAYSRRVLWDNGDDIVQSAFERPQLLIEDGKPTHIFAATGRNKNQGYWGFEGLTWNMVIPLEH